MLLAVLILDNQKNYLDEEKNWFTWTNLGKNKT